MASLDGATLQRLNARVQVDGESAESVAADYLQAQGPGAVSAPCPRRIDRLGRAAGDASRPSALLFLPFVVFKANRIVPGHRARPAGRLCRSSNRR